MLGVISYRGIGGCAVRSASIVDCEAGKITVFPGFAAVSGCRISDVAATPTDAAGPPRHVKCTDHRAAVAKDVRLDFRLVIAVSVGEIVDADSHRGNLGGARQCEYQEQQSHGQSRKMAAKAKTGQGACHEISLR